MKKVNTVSIEKVNHIKKHMKEVSYNLILGDIFSHEVYDNQTGYLQFYLAGETVYVHHFIAVAGGLDIVGKVVRKKDGDSKNNSFFNLEALSHAEVMKLASKRGAFSVPRSPRFTEEEVYEVLELQEKGYNDYELAKRYNRNHMVFAQIRWGKRYKDVIEKRNRQIALLKQLDLPVDYLPQIRRLLKNGVSEQIIAEASGAGIAVIKQFR